MTPEGPHLFLKWRIVKMETVQGIFQGFASGFGFVRVSETEELYIAREHVNGALPKDRVVCHILQEAQGERKAEAEVIHVLQHGLLRLPGNCIAQDLVMADDAAIQELIAVVPPEKGEGIAGQKGHKVIVRIVRWPEEGGLQGVIEEDLGDAYAPTARIRGILCMHDLPVDFPPEVLAETEPLSDQIEIPEEERKWREDLREVPMVTIDGEDARDLDDAVSLKKLDDGYELGVHIADVSWYVREGTALNQEAFKRGTSVYVTDRVVPMLPKKLSNGLCSLNEGEDRLAMSCIMRMDPQGRILDHRVVESLIRVDHRMSYTNVQYILEGSRLPQEERSAEQQAAMEQYDDWVETFCQMAELASLRRRMRIERGALDFEVQECKFQMDPYGYPQEITLRQQNEATHLIEEFMLAANETVAKEYDEKKIPFMYRVHPEPDEERVRDLGMQLRQLGRPLKGAANGRLDPGAVRKLLDGLQGEEKSMVSQMILRSMKQARYSSLREGGHFGLAAPYYCHFTSPIRRYPDLVVHRMIKACLRGQMSPEYAKKQREWMDRAAAHCSFTERRAQETEWDVEKYMKALYMSEHLREKTRGVVSGVTERGLYVELANTVEGFVPVEKLTGDYYTLDRKTGSMVGKRTGKVYTLGQAMSVCVDKVDMDTAMIYFRPLTMKVKKSRRNKKIRW